MSSPLDELNNFLKNYEVQANYHKWENIAPLIAESAVYWFSDGSYVGIDNIKEAFIRTFNKIQDEKYSINDIEWIAVSDNFAVCIYNFYWIGTVDGKRTEGRGRGTNVVVKSDGKWKMLHEHLSKTP